MRLINTNRIVSNIGLLVLTLVLTGCQIESEPKSALEQIRERGTLRVGTVNNQLSYYIGPDGLRAWIMRSLAILPKNWVFS